MAATVASPSAYQIDVFLDKPIYNPGDLVVGNINLQLAKKLPCDTISAQLYGSARVFFVQKITKPGALVQSKAFEQEQVLVDQTQNVWMTMNQNVQKHLTLDEIARRASSTAIRMPTSASGPGIEKGKHTFGFSFPLPPSGLHTSFDARGAAGYVRYYILVKIMNGSCIVLRKKLLFAVVCPKILVSYPLPKEEKTISQRKDFEKGVYLLVDLTLEKRVFVPGEPIMGRVSIENRSGKSVKYANLHIVQETVCYSSRPEIQIHESVFETAGMGLTVDKIRTGDALVYPIKFNIPALVPNLEVPNCIQTSYRIQLDVGFVRGVGKKTPVSIKVPISIGTHIQNLASSPPSFAFGAPPAYDEISNSENRENLAALYPEIPPQYSESVLGISSVEERDAPADYSPLCYHYNFGYRQDEADEVGSKKTN